MSFHPASTLSLYFFIALIISVWSLVIWKFKDLNSIKWPAIYFSLYTLSIVFSAYFDLTSKYMIPIAPLILIAGILISFFITFSNFGVEIATNLSFTGLLGINSFRFPLELILHDWAKTNTVPITMTWTGQNWDIIAGILCLIGIPFYKKSKKIVWFVQITSFMLLLNVFRVVIMSSPFPFSWELENPLLLIVKLPYALILPAFVVLALTSHLLVFRKLLK